VKFQLRDRNPSNDRRPERNTSQNTATSGYVRLNISIKTEDRIIILKIYKQVFYKIIDREGIFPP
jgi:hypothetical protein